MQKILIEGDLVFIGSGYGRAVVIDKIDRDLAKFQWHIDLEGYAVRQENNRQFKLHRVILGRKLARQLEPGETVDHINRLPNDNRRANLRLVNAHQNVWNSSKIKAIDGNPTSSRFKGVSYDNDKRKWRASLRTGGENRFLGYFDSELDAAIACDAFTQTHRGEYAVSNCFNKVRPLPVEDV